MASSSCTLFRYPAEVQHSLKVMEEQEDMELSFKFGPKILADWWIMILSKFIIFFDKNDA